MGMRECLEKKMTGLLFGLRQGTKSITDVMPTLNRLRNEFPLIAEDYEKKYINIVAARKQTA
jgi:hypothetical protein